MTNYEQMLQDAQDSGASPDEIIGYMNENYPEATQDVVEDMQDRS